MIPLDMLQRYINKWVSTAHDLFGVDESSSAHWAYVWASRDAGTSEEARRRHRGFKGNPQRRSRQHYHDEIVGEVRKLCGYLPEGAADLYVPHENFHREIGAFKRQRYTVEGTLFEGSDDEWTTYMANHLPPLKTKRT